MLVVMLFFPTQTHVSGLRCVCVVTYARIIVVAKEGDKASGDLCHYELTGRKAAGVTQARYQGDPELPNICEYTPLPRWCRKSLDIE